jgi:hypothetical protein
MDIPTQELRQLMKEVYSNGLNVYALVNKVQSQTSYALSPEVIELICREYLKYKPSIKKPYAWAYKVFKLIRDNAYVANSAKEEKKNKEVNKDLMLKLFGDKKWN